MEKLSGVPLPDLRGVSLPHKVGDSVELARTTQIDVVIRLYEQRKKCLVEFHMNPVGEA